MTCTTDPALAGLRVLAFIGAGTIICCAVIGLLAWSDLRGPHEVDS